WVRDVRRNDSESLDEWQKMVRYPVARLAELIARVPIRLESVPSRVIIPETTSDANGRFTLHGVGRERVVDDVIGGAGVEARRMAARTRDGEKVSVGPMGNIEQMMLFNQDFDIYGRTLRHIASPSSPVRGRVVDNATGQPLAGMQLAYGPFQV